MQQEGTLTRASLRAPRAGAIAGIIFSILLIASIGLIRTAVPANPDEAGTWLSGGWKGVQIALNLLPFAGVAFLWFIGVMRDRMGELEDRFFATVFLGSGILFLAMLFASSAVASTVLILHGTIRGRLIDSGLYAFGRTLAYLIMNVYAMKMAGVFMISSCTIGLRISILPKWMSYIGYALAVVLLLTSSHFHWSPLLFPMWALMVSTYVLFANLRSREEIGG